MTIVDHGVPIFTARQFATGLSPSADGTGWNLIIQSVTGPNPVEWIIIKDITGVHGAPTQNTDLLTTHTYADILYQYVNGKQLRAPNGKIFWLCFGNYVAVYDPTTEHVSLLGPIAESPPVDPNATWGPYSASFDTAGNLWMGTEESHFRASAIIFLDTTALTMSIKGYVGSGAASYSTYGKATAPDIGTSTKYVYEAYGENPWQLWALETVGGTATKLYEVGSSGNIQFADIAGQGWVATVDTALGQPSNVRTQWWCLDGNRYAYVPPFAYTCDHTIPHLHAVAHGRSTGEGPFRVSTGLGNTIPSPLVAATDYWWITIDADNFKLATSFANAMAGTAIAMTTNGSGVQTITQQAPSGLARSVTPTKNAPVSPPGLDLAGAVGVFGWRANGSTGAYTYVNYAVTYRTPSPIESLVASNGSGIVGNAQQYNGFVQYFEPADTHVWYGPLQSVAEGARLNVDGTIHIAAYPNGTYLTYNPDAPWQLNVNPLPIGAFGLQGIQFAGIKYANFLAWAPLAGASGRMICAGSRERNGSGCGIGSCDKTTKAFAGTFAAAGMSTALPTGLCVLGGLGRAVMASRLISPPGNAHLFVFDYSFSLVSSPTIASLSDLGAIFETSTPNVITGIVQDAGGGIGLWQYNVATSTYLGYTVAAITGTLSKDVNGILLYAQRADGSVWIMSGNNLVRVDVSALTATVQQDLTAYAPVVKMSFDSASTELWFAGGVNSGVGGAQLFSLPFTNNMAAEAGIVRCSGYRATFVIDGHQTLSAEPGVVRCFGFSAGLSVEVDVTPAGVGALDAPLVNDESTSILRCQPVYSSIDGGVRLATANNSGTSIVAGLVADASVAPGAHGIIRLGGLIEANTAEWDAVCGTVGGLAAKKTYYLHPSIPGRLTSTPSNDDPESVPVMRSLSPTQAIVDPKIAIIQ